MAKHNHDSPEASAVLAYRVVADKRRIIRHLFLRPSDGHGHCVTVENIPPFLTGSGLCQLVNEALTRIFNGKVKLATTIVDVEGVEEGEQPKGYHSCELRLRTKKQSRILLAKCGSLAGPISLSELADFHLAPTGMEKYASAYSAQFKAVPQNRPYKSVAAIVAAYEAAKAEGSMPTGADEDGWTVMTKGHKLAFKAPVNQPTGAVKRITSAAPAKRAGAPVVSDRPDRKKKKMK